MGAQAAKLGIVAPLADLLLQLGPPWPNHASVVAITVLFELVLYVFLYTILVQRRRLLRPLLIASTVGTLSVGALYIVLFANYVVPAPNYWHRVVVGSELLPEVAQEYAGKSLPSAKDLVANAGNNEDDVWTSSSLTAARLVILAVWLALFAQVTLVLATFVLL